MKPTFYAILIVLCFTKCSHKITDSALKNYKSIEGVKIGMNLNSAIDLANKKYYVEKTKILTYPERENEFEFFVYTNKLKKEVLYSFNGGYDKSSKDKIFRLVLRNPKYHTAEGICVGMTVNDLRAKASLKSAEFNNNDGLFIASAKFDGGYWMDIDTKKNNIGFDYTKPEIKTLPGDLKIKAIIIF